MEGVSGIERFLAGGHGYSNGHGHGYGSGGGGDGYGYGDGAGGDGYGYGDGAGGDGYGYGYGDGAGGDGYGGGSGNGGGSFGVGYGDGVGYGVGFFRRGGEAGLISSYCGSQVHVVDDVDTIIDRVMGSFAKGRIIRGDLTTERCYIAKVNGCFAHGETLREAVRDATAKALQRMPVEGRIAAFIAAHGDPDAAYPCSDLYDWHNRLTGSCEMGRKAFAHEHGIDIDRDSMTVSQFIDLTRNAYGGEIIRQLELRYEGAKNVG